VISCRVCSPVSSSPQWNEPDWDGLLRFLVEKLGLSHQQSRTYKTELDGIQVWHILVWGLRPPFTALAPFLPVLVLSRSAPD
jgi:hypothetical protein